MSVNEADAAIPPAELHKSPEQMQVSIPFAVVHSFGAPVAPQDLVTKIL